MRLMLQQLGTQKRHTFVARVTAFSFKKRIYQQTTIKNHPFYQSYV